MKRPLLSLVAIVVPALASAKGLVVTPSDFEGDWPFYAQSIELNCGVWESSAHVVFVAGGKRYPLDNGALVTSWENGFSPLHQAMKTVPQLRSGQQDADKEGLAGVKALAESARALCPETQE